MSLPKIYTYMPKIDGHFVETLQDLVNQTICLLTKQTTDDMIERDLNQLIGKITNLVMGGCDDRIIDHLVGQYMVIRQIICCPVDLWESDGTAQKKTTSSLANLLLKTLDGNYHQVVEQCSQLDKKTNLCKQGNPMICGTTKHLFKCSPFHEYDSVSAHLVLTSIYNGIYVVEQSYDDRKINEKLLLDGMLFGLFHDIAKPICVETYEMRSLITGFPAHAEVGAMMFQTHWSPEMDRWISKDRYIVIIGAVLRHMCGYHGADDHKNVYKRNLLLLEDQSVGRLLTVNRVGDHFGKLAPPETIEPPQHFFDEQKKFELHMQKNITFDLREVLKHSNAKGVRIKDDKIIIYLIGCSGSGKSHMAKKIHDTFPNQVVTISRDVCMAMVCLGISVRLMGKDYSMLYRIYETNRKLNTLAREAGKKKLSVQEQANFETAKKDFIIAQKNWNSYTDDRKDLPKVPIWDCSDQVPNIVGDVGMLFNKHIIDGIASNSLFVVIDSFINSFPMAVEGNLPKELADYFRVHIHVQSYIERQGTTIGESVEKQLKVSGRYGIDNPLHPDGFKGRFKKMFASLSSEIGVSGSLPNSTFASKFRPHLVAGICTRCENGLMGYDQTIEVLTALWKSVHSHAQYVERKIEQKIEQKDVDQADDHIGVDPETKDMNVKEYYQHLLKLYHGDRRKIKDHLRNLPDCQSHQSSFMHVSFLENYHTSQDGKSAEMTEELMYRRLAELSERWYVNSIVRHRHTAEEFAKDPDLYERYINSIVVLKYFEQYGARFWKNKWAKEMRGTVIFINPETLQVSILSFKLPRGAEAITGMVRKTGLETQDVKQSKIDILDDEQQDTCTLLCTGRPIDMYLTSKGDGSLLVINQYTGKALATMLPIVEIFGSVYTKLWANQSLVLTDGKRLYLPATQGTVVEGGFMAPYMVTSILVGSGIVCRRTLARSDSYLSAWEKYGDRFIQMMMRMKTFDPLTETHSFSFEAICKDRCGLFGDHPHNELACSYTRDRLIFLGCSITDRRQYIPHTIYSIGWSQPFEEPLWWKIDHADQVDQMIGQINQMILGRITKKQFLRQHIPNNNDFTFKKRYIDDQIIDFEGWVGMKLANLPITDPDHIESYNKTGINNTVYSKIKTEAYYRSHKFHAENIPYLSELAKTAGHIFPLSRKIAGICSDGVIARRLQIIGDQTMRLLDFSDVGPLMTELQRVFQENLDNAVARQDAGESVKLPKNPFVNFDKRPFDVKCRIALNFKGFNFGKLLVPIYLDVFPEIDPNIPDLEQMTTGLTMTLAPWENGYSDRIKVLNPRSASVQSLIVCCIGQSLV